jgi:drug/metabolite transporter (DMT)-like permease
MMIRRKQSYLQCKLAWPIYNRLVYYVTMRDEPGSLLKYDLTLILVTFIWGTTFVVAKEVLNTMPPLNYLTVRFIVASFLLVLISFKTWRSINRPAIVGGIVLGALLYGGFFTQAIGLAYTTPAKTAFVTGVSVILVPFFGYFFAGMPVTAEHLLAVVLAAFGFGLLTFPDTNEGINVGDLISLAGTVFWALHIVYTGVWARRVAARPLLLTQLLAASLFFTLSQIIFQMFGILPTLANDTWPLNFTTCTQILYLAVIATIGTILLQTRIQRHISATRAAIIFSLEPAFASFASYMALGERLGWRTGLGGVIIISAIIISSIEIFPRRAQDSRKKAQKAEIPL